jgi:hypothetical protein
MEKSAAALKERFQMPSQNSLMKLIIRSQFYGDIVEEIEYLARRAGAETADDGSGT